MLLTAFQVHQLRLKGMNYHGGGIRYQPEGIDFCHARGYLLCSQIPGLLVD